MRLRALCFLLLFSGWALGPPLLRAQQTSGNIIATGATTCSTTSNAANGCVILPINSTSGQAAVTLNGPGSTFTATVQFEASTDNQTSWYSISGNTLSGSSATSATAPGSWQFNVGSVTHLRARSSSFSSGPIYVNINATPTSAKSNAAGSTFTAAGDLSGSSSAQQVVGIKNNTLPGLSTGYLNWTGSVWAFSSPFTAGGDLSGSATSQQVTGIQNNALPTLSTGYLNWTGSAWAYSSPPGSTWNTVGNPGGAATFSMAGNTSTFNYTSALANAFSWIDTTAATNVLNQNSPQLNIASNYWSGVSSQNNWTEQQVCGTGTNPACNLVFAGAGTSGGGNILGPGFGTNAAGGGFYAYGQGTDPNLTTATPPILNSSGWGGSATIPTSFLCLFPGSVPLTGANIITCGGTADARGNYQGTFYTVDKPRASSCTSNVDTVLSTDNYGYVTWSDASPCAVTLPQASTLPTNFFLAMGCNINAGAVTITPTTSTISYTNGGNSLLAQSSVALSKGQCITISSDNTNFTANVYTANATTVNGAAVPASANGISTNASSQATASTAHNTAVPLTCSDVSGSGTTQSCTTTPSFAPAANDCVIYTSTTANTGALTLNVNASTAAPVQKFFGTAVASGDVPANKPQLACYDGTNWQLMSGFGLAVPPASCNIVQTNSSRQLLCQGSIALSAGKFSTFNAETTAGVSTVYERGVTSQKAETGSADASVLAVTPASAVGTYRVSYNAFVSSATSGVISFTLSWTDSNGTAQANLALPLFQQGTAAPNTTFTTSAASIYEGSFIFDVNNAGSAITLKWVGGGTTAAKVSAVVERLQ